MIDGYYSDDAEVIVAALRLAIRGCDMSTFCYPGTEELDHRAVNEAYAYMKSSLSLEYEDKT